MAVIDQIPGFAPTREVKQEGAVVIVTVTPPAFMGLPPASVRLTIDQYKCYLLWRERGVLIQEALPDLSPADREILISGIGPDDFANLADEEDGQ